MTTITTTFTNALLADAAYVGGLDSSSDLVTKLKPRMTETLADFISKNFSVVTQIESAGSSFEKKLGSDSN